MTEACTKTYFASAERAPTEEIEVDAVILEGNEIVSRWAN